MPFVTISDFRCLKNPMPAMCPHRFFCPLSLGENSAAGVSTYSLGVYSTDFVGAEEWKEVMLH